MSSYKIHYFNFRGRGEAIRFLLSYGGIEFEDIRFEEDEWPKIKPSMPYGKVPVLEVDGVKYSHTLAICNLLGEKLNIAGSNEVEKAQIQTAANFVYDLIGILEGITYYYKEYMDKDGFQKALEKFTKETVPENFARFDAMIAANKGYFVNGKLTWVDIYFASFADYFNAIFEYVGEEVKEDFFGNFENLKGLRDKILGIEGIKKWIAKRPVTVA